MVASATVQRQGSVLWSKFVGIVEFSVCQWVIRKFHWNDSQWIWIFNSLDLRKNLSKNDTAFRKTISVQERLALTLHFLASGDSYLQYLFKISKHAISCIVPEVWDILFENLKDYIQIRQILLFVVYERSFKLDFNQKFYFSTNFTAILLLKTCQIILKALVY